MSRQPKEKWCPYCREAVDQWESQRKKYSTRNTANQQKIRPNVKYWFLCPHCKQKHPWWQYEWLQALFLLIGLGGVIAVNGLEQTQMQWVYTVVIGAAIAAFLTLLFRCGYVWFKFRDQPKPVE